MSTTFADHTSNDDEPRRTTKLAGQMMATAKKIPGPKKKAKSKSLSEMPPAPYIFNAGDSDPDTPMEAIDPTAPFTGDTNRRWVLLELQVYGCGAQDKVERAVRRLQTGQEVYE